MILASGSQGLHLRPFFEVFGLQAVGRAGLVVDRPEQEARLPKRSPLQGVLLEQLLFDDQQRIFVVALTPGFAE